MSDAFLEIAYARARLAQQRMLKRRRAAARRPYRETSRTDNPRISPTQRTGHAHEGQALQLLTAAGLVPLARNLHCRMGEVDLVMRDGQTLVFVEVRARAAGRYGGAAASVGAAKQARLARCAALLLPGLARQHWGGRTPPVRFDVVAFEGEQAHWLPAAFTL